MRDPCFDLLDELLVALRQLERASQGAALVTALGRTDVLRSRVAARLQSAARARDSGA
jgi:hypothetical protein